MIITSVNPHTSHTELCYWNYNVPQCSPNPYIDVQRLTFWFNLEEMPFWYGKQEENQVMTLVTNDGNSEKVKEETKKIEDETKKVEEIKVEGDTKKSYWKQWNRRNMDKDKRRCWNGGVICSTILPYCYPSASSDDSMTLYKYVAAYLSRMKNNLSFKVSPQQCNRYDDDTQNPFTEKVKLVECNTDETGREVVRTARETSWHAQSHVTSDTRVTRSHIGMSSVENNEVIRLVQDLGKNHNVISGKMVFADPKCNRSYAITLSNKEVMTMFNKSNNTTLPRTESFNENSFTRIQSFNKNKCLNVKNVTRYNDEKVKDDKKPSELMSVLCSDMMKTKSETTKDSHFNFKDFDCNRKCTVDFLTQLRLFRKRWKWTVSNEGVTPPTRNETPCPVEETSSTENMPMMCPTGLGHVIKTFSTKLQQVCDDSKYKVVVDREEIPPDQRPSSQVSKLSLFPRYAYAARLRRKAFLDRFKPLSPDMNVNYNNDNRRTRPQTILEKSCAILTSMKERLQSCSEHHVSQENSDRVQNSPKEDMTMNTSEKPVQSIFYPNAKETIYKPIKRDDYDGKHEPIETNTDHAGVKITKCLIPVVEYNQGKNVIGLNMEAIKHHLMTNHPSLNIDRPKVITQNAETSNMLGCKEKIDTYFRKFPSSSKCQIENIISREGIKKMTNNSLLCIPLSSNTYCEILDKHFNRFNSRNQRYAARQDYRETKSLEPPRSPRTKIDNIEDKGNERKNNFYSKAGAKLAREQEEKLKTLDRKYRNDNYQNECREKTTNKTTYDDTLRNRSNKAEDRTSFRRINKNYTEQDNYENLHQKEEYRNKSRNNPDREIHYSNRNDNHDQSNRKTLPTTHHSRTQIEFGEDRCKTEERNTHDDTTRDKSYKKKQYFINIRKAICNKEQQDTRPPQNYPHHQPPNERCEESSSSKSIDRTPYEQGKPYKQVDENTRRDEKMNRNNCKQENPCKRRDESPCREDDSPIAERNMYKQEDTYNRTDRNYNKHETPYKRRDPSPHRVDDSHKRSEKNQSTQESPCKRNTKNPYKDDDISKRVDGNFHRDESPYKIINKSPSKREIPRKRIERIPSREDDSHKRTERNPNGQESPRKRIDKGPCKEEEQYKRFNRSPWKQKDEHKRIDKSPCKQGGHYKRMDSPHKQEDTRKTTTKYPHKEEASKISNRSILMRSKSYHHTKHSTVKFRNDNINHYDEEREHGKTGQRNPVTRTQHISKEDLCKKVDKSLYRDKRNESSPKKPVEKTRDLNHRDRKQWKSKENDACNTVNRISCTECYQKYPKRISNRQCSSDSSEKIALENLATEIIKICKEESNEADREISARKYRQSRKSSKYPGKERKSHCHSNDSSSDKCKEDVCDPCGGNGRKNEEKKWSRKHQDPCSNPRKSPCKTKNECYSKRKTSSSSTVCHSNDRFQNTHRGNEPYKTNVRNSPEKNRSKSVHRNQYGNKRDSFSKDRTRKMCKEVNRNSCSLSSDHTDSCKKYQIRKIAPNYASNKRKKELERIAHENDVIRIRCNGEESDTNCTTISIRSLKRTTANRKKDSSNGMSLLNEIIKFCCKREEYSKAEKMRKQKRLEDFQEKEQKQFKCKLRKQCQVQKPNLVQKCDRQDRKSVERVQQKHQPNTRKQQQCKPNTSCKPNQGKRKGNKCVQRQDSCQRKQYSKRSQSLSTERSAIDELERYANQQKKMIEEYLSCEEIKRPKERRPQQELKRYSEKQQKLENKRRACQKPNRHLTPEQELKRYAEEKIKLEDERRACQKRQKSSQQRTPQQELQRYSDHRQQILDNERRCSQKPQKPARKCTPQTAQHELKRYAEQQREQADEQRACQKRQKPTRHLTPEQELKQYVEEQMKLEEECRASQKRRKLTRKRSQTPQQEYNRYTEQQQKLEEGLRACQGQKPLNERRPQQELARYGQQQHKKQPQKKQPNESVKEGQTQRERHAQQELKRYAEQQQILEQKRQCQQQQKKQLQQKKPKRSFLQQELKRYVQEQQGKFQQKRLQRQVDQGGTRNQRGPGPCSKLKFLLCKKCIDSDLINTLPAILKQISASTPSDSDLSNRRKDYNCLLCESSGSMADIPPGESEREIDNFEYCKTSVPVIEIQCDDNTFNELLDAHPDHSTSSSSGTCTLTTSSSPASSNTCITIANCLNAQVVGGQGDFDIGLLSRNVNYKYGVISEKCLEKELKKITTLFGK